MTIKAELAELVVGGAPVEVDTNDLTRRRYLGATASNYAALPPE